MSEDVPDHHPGHPNQPNGNTHTTEVADEELIEREFNTLLDDIDRGPIEVDANVVRRAYEYARDKHRGQRRDSGEPYVLHPIAVARIISQLPLDQTSVLAALLHDVLEMTDATPEEIKTLFDAHVLRVVQGVTKAEYHVSRVPLVAPSGSITGPEEASEQPVRTQGKRFSANIRNLRHFLLAIVEDFRVIPVKLADRLHNMRTLDSKLPEAQRRIALETQHIYAPLAHRVGIWQLKAELEDLAFKYIEPEQYRRIAELVAATREERIGEVQEAIKTLEKHLASRGLPNAQVTGRAKHLYSIYRKMREQNLDFADIYDLVAIRVIVDTRPQCYEVLGYVSELWHPIDKSFADYIANPKSNMYQSIHIKVYGPRQKPMEVQIRTWEMHETAEFGLAAHWAYREKGEQGRADDLLDRRVSELRRILLESSELKTDADFYQSVLKDVFGDQVIVFTPKGEPHSLPKGATALDFAYRIHTQVGHTAVGARVGDRYVELSYECQNGDIIEIDTRKNASPSLDWLQIAKTTHARSKIKAYFRKLSFDENLERGRQLLSAELQKAGLDPQLASEEKLQQIAAELNHPGPRELLASIGNGTLSTPRVLRKLAPPTTPVVTKRKAPKPAREDDIIIFGSDDIKHSRAICCRPLPGDEVAAYLSRTKGAIIHRAECPNLAHFMAREPDRIVHHCSYKPREQLYLTAICVECNDRTWLLTDVARAISEMGVYIQGSGTRTNKSRRRALLKFIVELKSAEQYNLLADRLLAMTDVISVYRPMARKKVEV